MGSYGSLLIFMRVYVSLWLLISPFAFLWVGMGPNGSL